MNSLLEVKDLSVSFGREQRIINAVQQISFSIKKGETLALVGESGSGKSVTALSIMQLLPYPLAYHPTGSILYKNEELIGAKDSDLRKLRGDQIAMIFQEPLNSLNPLHSIKKQLSEVLLLHKMMPINKALQRVEELLYLVGLEEAITRLNALPHEFSGGQQQRIMIAMALANDPELLIADEPTTALDVTIQAQVLELLKDLQSKLGMAMLFITHNLGIVKEIAENVCVMNKGKIVESGDVKKIFSTPHHTFTKHLIQAEPKGTLDEPPQNRKKIIESLKLQVWYPIKKGVLRRTVANIKAVDGVSLFIRQGHTLGLVGESGSGKSTLGRALLRLEDSNGPIIFQGQNIESFNNIKMRPLRREMQIVFQDPFSSLSPRLSVGQIIEEGLIVHQIGKSQIERDELISKVLYEVGLDPNIQDRFPHEFSGGQRQRISISRALILQPRFIIFDEPTSALDMSVQAQILSLLLRLQKKYNLTYMFISHDLKVVKAISHHIAVLKKGKIVEYGPTKSIINAPKEPYTQTLMAAAFHIKHH